MKKRKYKSKKYFLSNYPDESLYADKVKVQAKDTNGYVMTDTVGDAIIQTVLIVRDQSVNDQ